MSWRVVAHRFVHAILSVMTSATPGHKTAEAFLDAYLRELWQSGIARATRSGTIATISAISCVVPRAGVGAATDDRQQFREYLGELRATGIVRGLDHAADEHGARLLQYLLHEHATEQDLLYGIALPKRPKRLPKVLDRHVLTALIAAPDAHDAAGAARPRDARAAVWRRAANLGACRAGCRAG